MANINNQVSRLINYGLQKKLIHHSDAVYAENRLLAQLGVVEYERVPIDEELRYPAEILGEMCDFAFETGVLKSNTTDARDQFDTELMNCLMPRPSEVIAQFNALYGESPKAASDYYYNLSRSSNYIRVDRVKKDKIWTTPTEYGDMIITVNLSKPEKDPNEIAAAKAAPQAGYPKCALCRENEGFFGSVNQAARGNHRLIPFKLANEDYFLQYSPYVYYNEHCIILNREHKPMKVDRACFEKLLSFTEFLPHYFAGSNADLPIVGGSILSHDHFQGGNFEFPMAKAGIRESVSFTGFEDVEAGIVHWPMSVIRIKSAYKNKLVDLADKILAKWRGYSDESQEILAFSDGEPHNTITPIARRRDGKFELDLVLRNNRTTLEHPLGIFHPHAEYHHIKRENIGLIEVMGLAILPPRLLTEIAQLKEALINGKKAEEIMKRADMQKHIPWFKELREQGISPENLDAEIQRSIGHIFKEILANSGVYKQEEVAMKAFKLFFQSVSG